MDTTTRTRIVRDAISHVDVMEAMEAMEREEKLRNDAGAMLERIAVTQRIERLASWKWRGALRYHARDIAEALHSQDHAMLRVAMRDAVGTMVDIDDWLISTTDEAIN